LSSALLAVITRPRSLGQRTLRSRYPIRASGFQYVPQDACLKLDFSQSPDLPGYPSHVSVSWALPQALASWDILLRHGMRPGRHLPLQEQHKQLCQKLRGYYQYYAVRDNVQMLRKVHRHVERSWRYWLSRRSRKSKIPWKECNKLWRYYPLPVPKIIHAI
jgi:hypothetical protein